MKTRVCLLPGVLLSGLFAAELALSAQPAAPAPARRIVSLAPHLTELVYDVGAGDRLVGVEAFSDYPEAAKKLPRVGDAFHVDYEQVVALKPDLVLVWNTGTPEPVIEKLGGLGLRVHRVTISHLDDIGGALRGIGALTGMQAQAEAAAKAYEKNIAGLRAQHTRKSPVTVFYQISEKPLYTVNGKHLISEVIELCGGENIFANLKQLAPPVSLEAVIELNPQAILTGSGAAGDPVSVWKPWKTLRAVRDTNLYVVNADLLARSTPRIVEGVSEVCGVLDKARERRGKDGTKDGRTR